jgi:hypothetical protein
MKASFPPDCSPAEEVTDPDGTIRYVLKDGTEIHRIELQPAHDYETGLPIFESAIRSLWDLCLHLGEGVSARPNGLDLDNGSNCGFVQSNHPDIHNPLNLAFVRSVARSCFRNLGYNSQIVQMAH